MMTGEYLFTCSAAVQAMASMADAHLLRPRPFNFVRSRRCNSHREWTSGSALVEVDQQPSRLSDSGERSESSRKARPGTSKGINPSDSGELSSQQATKHQKCRPETALAPITNSHVGSGRDLEKQGDWVDKPPKHPAGRMQRALAETLRNTSFSAAVTPAVQTGQGLDGPDWMPVASDRARRRGEGA
ncbi:uncharacterized protein N7459_007154 [Penicillium hispanicum]|uniref:uncharacterized protein n=1 Tax=Penicillium hispanicum TaxID=1080232 RepID=UPI00254009B3|nr:uncharacterized protein N7459_007154 [Penicillium hispanicum]KAJ5578190.1 hypothetical protein N7459_007154 [Penicillium hispanicum]